MFFTSIEFWIFLPVVFVAHWLCACKKHSPRWQNLTLAVAGYIFYGWLDWRFCGLLAISTGVAFAGGVLMEGMRHEARRKMLLWLAVGLNLGILGFFKYYDFFAQSLANCLSTIGLQIDAPTLHLILPIGVSFYSFMSISYVADVYRRERVASHDLLAFVAYMNFFPQLLAGPIGRAGMMLPQFERTRTFDYALATDGCRQMLWGLFKKVVVADACASAADVAFASYQNLPAFVLAMGLFYYAIQIYCDFSGYSDIAIGCGKLFGIRLMKNFDCPYFATNIAEFWRRWHISLTTWFRDYVYIPLGGGRCSKAKKLRNTFVVFLLSGLWHGANWTFVAWGFVHACLFVPLIAFSKRKGTSARKGGFIRTLLNVARWGMTFALVMCAWAFFRADTIQSGVAYLSKLLTRDVFVPCYWNLRVLPWIVILLAVELCTRANEHALSKVPSRKFFRWGWYVFLCIAVVANLRENSSFVYFQF